MTLIIEAHGLDLGANSDTRDSCCGMKIAVQATAITLTKVTKHVNCTADTAYLQDVGFTELASAAFLGNDATFDYNLSANTSYYITAKNADDSEYTRAYHFATPEPYPIAGTYINWTYGINFQNLEDDINSAQNIVSIIVDDGVTGAYIVMTASKASMHFR